MDKVIPLTRACSCCKIIKALEEFPKSKTAKYGRSNWCIECHRSYSNTEVRRKQNKERRQKMRRDPQWKERERLVEKARRDIRVKETMLTYLRSRAKVKNLDFDLTLEDIPDFPELCPILGVPMVKYTKYAPSADRRDSTKGYVKGNIWIISTQANRMKSNANSEELIAFSKYWLHL